MMHENSVTNTIPVAMGSYGEPFNHLARDSSSERTYSGGQHNLRGTVVIADHEPLGPESAGLVSGSTPFINILCRLTMSSARQSSSLSMKYAKAHMLL